MSGVTFEDKPKSSGAAEAKAAAETANKETLDKMKEGAKKEWASRSSRWRFMWNVRGQMALSLLGCGIGGYFMVLPFVRDTVVDLLSYNRPVQEAAEALPTMSVAWWTNQWRKGVQTWRAGESIDDFFNPICDYILEETGKDIRDAVAAHGYDASRASFVVDPRKMLSLSGAPLADPKPYVPSNARAPGIVEVIQAPNTPDGRNSAHGERTAISDPGWDKIAPDAADLKLVKSKFAHDNTRPRALVPLCGDSPMVRNLAHFGYNVDGVDGADIAISTLVDNAQTLFGGWNDAALHRMQLHFCDIFEPALWRILPLRGYDLIYDRQGLSAIDPDAREDYAFVLKRALKPDGLLYVEGTFRTKRVFRVRRGGPPFHFGKKELTNLFPLTEGYLVKCQPIREIQREDLLPEHRVTGQVPKELHVRHFPCVIWRDEAAAKKELQALQNQEFR